MISAFLLSAAIVLGGVRGDDLRARAYFDANNVLVGDPMVLTIDFIGRADFQSLHPPALAKAIDRRAWKLDDESAKTDSFNDARRVVYRVRPLKEGVWWFPELKFEFEGSDGAMRRVRSNPIPVHVKPGAQVVVAEMKEDQETYPAPPELLTVTSVPLAGDAEWNWRRALASPSVAAFAAFDFPEARMNEARMAILAGDWVRALKVYRALEWRLGQTPEIEQGMRAALALKYANPAAELPVWRVVLRPLLRFAWRGRVGLAAGAVAVLFLFFFALGRLLRAFALVLFALALFTPVATRADDDSFRMFEAMHERMRARMQNALSMPFGGAETPRTTVTASLALDRAQVTTGEDFAFLIDLEVPRNVTLSNLRLTPTEAFALQFVGEAASLPDRASDDPSNVVRRISVPARYHAPFKGEVAFEISGEVSGRMTRGGGRKSFSFTFSNSFAVRTPPLVIKVAPLPSAGQPGDFSGLIASHVTFGETLDLKTPETNDVVVITYTLTTDGYLPSDWAPEGVAFEWTREMYPARGGETRVEWKRYFVADGSAETPRVEFSSYDPKTKSYRRHAAGGTRVDYRN